MGASPGWSRLLGLRMVPAVASLGRRFTTVTTWNASRRALTVRSQAAASSRNQQNFPARGWTRAAGSGFSFLSSKTRFRMSALPAIVAPKTTLGAAFNRGSVRLLGSRRWGGHQILPLLQGGVAWEE